MAVDTETQNGNGSAFNHFLKDIPCGCKNRKEIMSAGEWQKDAIIVGALLVAIIGIIAIKRTNFKLPKVDS